jgi:flagellar hook-length control protein FliK
MNSIQDIVIAATAPPPPKVDSQKTNDGDQSFQGELDVKIKATQEKQKQTEDQQSGTTVLAGAGAVSPQATQAVIMQEVIKLVEQVSSAGQQSADLSLLANQGLEVTAQTAAALPTDTQTLFSDVLQPLQGDTQQSLAGQIAELNPVVSYFQSVSQIDPNAKKAADATSSQVSAPVVPDTELPAASIETGKLEIPAEVLVSLENKVQLQGLSDTLTAVSSQSAVEQLPVMQQVIDGIKKMSNDGQTTLKLQLHPENMGKIDIRLVSKPDGLQVFITSDKSSTNQALESNLSQLRDSLLSAGVKIGGMNVGQQQHQGNFQSWQSQQQVSRYTFSGIQGFSLQDGLTGQVPVGSLSALDARV